MRISVWNRSLPVGLLLGCVQVMAIAGRAGGQGPATRFTTGGRDLVRLDFASTPVGEFPSTLTMLNGVMDVVDKNGQRMLRASARSAVLIPLPELLPRDFTVEVDFIPKVGGFGEDVALEGTREINQGESSANILWHPARVGVVGGARDNYEAALPEAITKATAGQLTKLVMAVENETIKLYTNGRLTTMLPNRKFVRARVVRLLLGGEGDGDQAVYLAAVRLTTPAPPVGPLIAGQSPPTAGQVAGAGSPALGGASSVPNATSSNSTAPAVTAPPSAAAVPSSFAVTVTMGAVGPVVSWSPLATASGYGVTRWKIDDGNCCNNASPRGYTAISPWQDQPLPMSGTYVYRVVALTAAGVVNGETQFGFRMPAGAPVATALPATQPTGTITAAPAPSNPLGPAPAAKPTTINTAPAPTNLSVNGSPTLANLRWSPVPNANRYDVRRTLAGTTGWTTSGSVAINPFIASLQLPIDPTFSDTVPDHTKTYTYLVAAYQPDGTFGSATVDFTPPTPIDPTGFIATAIAPGQVRFDWDAVTVGAGSYLLGGPGTGTGIAVAGAPNTKQSYTLSGVPSGTHTWTIASVFEPGGVLTPSSAWPKATATVSASASNSARYEISVESVQLQSPAVDDYLHADGLQNEFYITAFVKAKDGSGTVLSETSHRSATYGDITYWPPPARVRGGTAGPAGGVWAQDHIEPIWEQPNAASQGYTRLVLWSGMLTSGQETVDIHPVIWESDNVAWPSIQHDADVRKYGYYVLDLDTRTSTGDISNVMLPDEQNCQICAFSGYFSHPDLGKAEDRPIGYASDDRDPLTNKGRFYWVAIRVDRTIAERALSGGFGPPGLIPLRLVDHLTASKSTFTHPDFGMGDYTLNIRIKRLP